jgi:hypothetical protein
LKDCSLKKHLRCFARKDDLSGYIETRIDMEIGMPA